MWLRRLAWSIAWVSAAAGVLAGSVAAWWRSRTYGERVTFTWADGTRFTAETFPGGVWFRRETSPGKPAGPAAGWSAARYWRSADVDWAIYAEAGPDGRLTGPSTPPFRSPWVDPSRTPLAHRAAGFGWAHDRPADHPQSPRSTPLGRRPFDAVGVPFWFVAATAGTAGVLVPALRYGRQRRRGNGGLCPGCGYDLRATLDRCPECGAVPG